MNPSFETLLFETRENGIAIITINRPDKLNALNTKVLDELDSAISSAVNESSIRVILITGAGEKAFVAGADIKELSSLDKKDGVKLSEKGQQIFQKIEDSPKPVLAIVNGYALGGGAELAMSCHIRIATENAVFGLPEVGLGIIPGYGGTQRLPELVGKSMALEMILTGRQVRAEQAKSIGLVNIVLETGSATTYAFDLAEKILKNGPLAISRAIEAVNTSGSENGFQKEAELFGKLCETRDFKEGTTAFLEKRKPNFKGS